MIEVRNLTKVFETVNYNIIAVSDANFDFVRGEVVVLLGRSGSGKSTLLNVLGGFDTSYAGTYNIDGISVKDLNPIELDDLRRKRIGFVFQDYVLLDNLTIVENVELALNVLGVHSKRGKRRASMDALELVGLVEHADKYPHQLSGGQQQRVAIARAFVKNPDIIIADEPTAALDSKTSQEVMDLLVSLCKTKLLIIATHNRTIVRDYGTRVIELNSGYTIKDQLILSKKDVEVGELDKLIDEDLGIVVTELDDHGVQVAVEDTIQTTILEDLDVNLSDFKLKKQRNFEIDANLKQELLDKRKGDKEVEKQRLKRFVRVEESMVGKLKYSISSFRRYFSIHAFSIFLFVIFLLTISFTFNFAVEIFSGFNSSGRYIREMNNYTETIYFDETYSLGSTGQSDGDFIINEGDLNMYDDKMYAFQSGFAHVDMLENSYFNNLFKDPSYIIKSKLAKFAFIGCTLDYNLSDIDNKCTEAVYYNDYLNIEKRNLFIDCYVKEYDTENDKDILSSNCKTDIDADTYITTLPSTNGHSTYYNNSVVFGEVKDILSHPTMIFEDFDHMYAPVSVNPSSGMPLPKAWVYATNIMGVNQNEATQQVNFVYSESAKTVLEDHLVEGGKLPTKDNEVVLPISYLFDLDILDQSETTGNYIDSTAIYQKYLEALKKDPSIGKVTIKQEVISLGADDVIDVVDPNMLLDDTLGENEFDIVGFVNLRYKTNTQIEVNSTLLSLLNLDVEETPIIVSNKATNKVLPRLLEWDDMTIAAQTAAGGDPTLLDDMHNMVFYLPMYIEIDKELYTNNDLSTRIDTFTNKYETLHKEKIIQHFEADDNTSGYLDILRPAHATMLLNLSNPSTTEINATVFPNVSQKTLRNYMVAEYFYVKNQHLVDALGSVDTDSLQRDKSAYLMSGPTDFATTDILYAWAMDESNGIKDEFEESLNNIERLSNRRAINRVIYEEYASHFTKMLYLDSLDDPLLQFYGSYPTLYEQSNDGFYGLVQSLVPIPLPLIEEFIPWGLGSAVVGLIESVDESEGIQSLLAATNLDLVLTGMTYNPTKSFIMLILISIIFVIVILFLILLSLVLVNLFGNIFEASSKRRKKEVGSLRILGTPFKDVKHLIKLENTYTLVITGIITGLLVLLISNVEAINPANYIGSSTISHYYMPLLELYFDFNTANIVQFSLFTVAITVLIFHFYVNKFIMGRVSVSRIKDINSIEAIKGDD